MDFEYARHNEGNTALHVSINVGNQDIFCLLLENPEVQLNLTNKNGETSLDLSQSKIRDGCFCAWVNTLSLLSFQA